MLPSDCCGSEAVARLSVVDFFRFLSRSQVGHRVVGFWSLQAAIVKVAAAGLAVTLKSLVARRIKKTSQLSTCERDNDNSESNKDEKARVLADHQLC